jgi:tetratricopeptide (TPR) repeat protein
MTTVEADALVDRAAELIDAGKLPDALANLDEARIVYESAGDLAAVAKCLQLSATVCRLSGDFDRAIERAAGAEVLAEAGTPTLVAAIAEQGEVEILRGAHGIAADHYARALVEGQRAGLLPDHAARLMRKRAMVLAAAGRFDEAAASAREGRALHEQTGALGEARRATVELAVVLEQAGDADAVEAVIAEGMATAAEAGDAHVAADLELLAAGRAVLRKDLAEGMAAARRARAHALQATAVLSYISAVMSIADIADATGDRDAAYEALASGWVTAGDAIGEAAARQVFEPKLAALRDAWGSAAFAGVRDAYNDRRRAALRGDGSDRA